MRYLLTRPLHVQMRAERVCLRCVIVKGLLCLHAEAGSEDGVEP
jgi:hypothetical protein